MLLYIYFVVNLSTTGHINIDQNLSSVVEVTIKN